MTIRKLAVAAVGLCLMVGGPAATLATPERALADPPTCQQSCENAYNYNTWQCMRRLPPVPSENDEMEYNECMSDAFVTVVMCNEGCPPETPDP